MRRLFRILTTLAGVIVGALWIRIGAWRDRRAGRFPLGPYSRHAQRTWCRWFCRHHGIRIDSSGGEPAPAPVLVVANHLSWLDIIVVSAEIPAVFVSKSEVAEWPLIGAAATGLGTLYIRRGQRAAAAEAAAAMATALARGERVLLFPEGTTGSGSDILPFRPRLMQSALDAGVPLQPLVIRYLYPDGEPCAEVPFLDPQSLPGNLWRLAAVPRLTARLEWLPPLDAAGASRSVLSKHCRERMRRRLRAGLAAEHRAP